MKKVLSVILAASLITSLFAACGSEKKSGDSHTLYFRDASKSKEAVATFFNSDTGESTEVKMERGSEDDEAVTFTCEGNTSEYNMAYITYDSISTDKFAFNKCTSGWYNSDHGFLPYTYGREINYSDSYDDVTLTCNGYDKTVHIRTPDDYDPKSDEKYSTVYLLDGTAMVFLGLDGMQLTDSELANEQVRAMTSVTGKKAIIVAVETFGDNNNYTRDDELIPDLGKMAHQEGTSKKNAKQTADFIGNTLIPYVQEHYNVYADAEHTSIAGTSLGGLGAFYITMEIPDKIGTVGALSPSFWTYDDNAWRSFLSDKKLDETAPFIYIYTGGKNDTGKEAKEMYERLKDMGYPQEKLAFHYNENGGHSVPFWRAIFPEFLEAAMFGHIDVLQK